MSSTSDSVRISALPTAPSARHKAPVQHLPEEGATCQHSLSHWCLWFHVRRACLPTANKAGGLRVLWCAQMSDKHASDAARTAVIPHTARLFGVGRHALLTRSILVAHLELELQSTTLHVDMSRSDVCAEWCNRNSGTKQCLSCLSLCATKETLINTLCYMTSSVFDCAGTLPSSWSASNSLPHLRTLNLTDNLLNGTLPAQWGSQAQAFPSLEVLDVALNYLNGTLPSTWCGAGFPVSNLPNSHVFTCLTTCQPLWCLPMWLSGLLLGTLASVVSLARSSTLQIVTFGSMLSSFHQLIGH